jgi:hypothetical protein
LFPQWQLGLMVTLRWLMVTLWWLMVTLRWLMVTLRWLMVTLRWLMVTLRWLMVTLADGYTEVAWGYAREMLREPGTKQGAGCMPSLGMNWYSGFNSFLKCLPCFPYPGPVFACISVHYMHNCPLHARLCITCISVHYVHNCP